MTSELQDRIALACAAYVFTALLWLFGQPLWAALLLAVGPIVLYLLAGARYSRTSARAGVRGRAAAQALLACYLVGLVAFSLRHWWG